MFQCSEALATWQFSAAPTHLAPGESLSCRKLPDHRLAYLTYEGPIRGNRGEVRRVEAGSYEPISVTPARWEVTLHGQTVIGRYELVQEESGEDSWTLRRLA